MTDLIIVTVGLLVCILGVFNIYAMKKYNHGIF